MKSILNRYLFLQILATSASLGFVLIAAIWILQSLRFVELVLSTKSSMWMFGRLAFLSLPDLCALILPIAVFISTLVVLNRLITEREFAVMQSCGQSRYKIVLPFLKFAGLIMGLLFVINVFISPLSQSKLKSLQFRLKNALPAILIQEGVFNEFGKMVVYVKSKRGDHLKGVFVSSVDKKDNSRVIITAQEGHLITDEKSPKILLFHGTRQSTDPKTHKISSLFFTETIVSLQGKEESSRSRGKKPQEMPFLSLLFPDKKYSQTERRLFKAEAHQKIITPYLVVVFVLIAAALLTTGSFSRKGVVKKIVFSVLAVVAIQGFVLFLLNQSAKFPFAILLNYIFLVFLSFLLFAVLTDIKNFRSLKIK